MRKAIVSFSIAAMGLLWCIPAFARTVEHPVGRPVHAARDWPVGLVELLNRPGRVYGYSGPLGGIDAFFYAGDTEEFNEFLVQYARLKGTALTLLLHTGREHEDKWLESKKVRYDWKVHITPRSRPVNQKERRYTVTVEVRLGGQVELGKMKVPLNVQVKSGGDAGKSGDIAKFIAAHEEKRKEAEEADE